MLQYQVYLNDEQKTCLLKYMRERRYTSMIIMIISSVLLLVSLLFCNSNLNVVKTAVISVFLVSVIKLKFNNEERLGKITWICFIVLFIFWNITLLGFESFSYDANMFLNKIEFYLGVVILTEIFITEFVRGFGKTFGYKCDIQCIKKDLYILDYGDFGYREKDTKKHSYYICDNRGENYICPRFLDYRNADTGSKFLYIKLENGRGYAVADN